jgi:hypothetical protein
LTLAAISPADVRAYRDKLSKEGRAPSTVNLQIKKVLNVPFSAAERHGYIPLNPCGAVDSLRKGDTGDRETFTEEQVRKLVNASKGDWAGAVLAGYGRSIWPACSAKLGEKAPFDPPSCKAPLSSARLALPLGCVALVCFATAMPAKEFLQPSLIFLQLHFRAFALAF